MQKTTLAKGSARISLTSAQTGEVTGTVRFTPTGNDLSMQGTAAGQAVRLVYVKRVLYIATGEKIGGRSWLKIDAKSGEVLGPEVAASVDGLRSSSDLAGPLKVLKGVQAHPGTAVDVDGVQTTPYTVRLNSRQLLVMRPAAERAALAKRLAGATSEITYYVDDTWLPHKIDVATTAGGKKSQQTVSYTAWGQRVTIVAPKATDVAILPKL